MERNEPCWCGSGKKYKKCHMPIDEKIQLHADRGEIVPSRAILKTPAQIEMIRKSADLNTAVLDEVAKHIRIGMSTAEIDEIVYRFTTEHGGIPAPLNYQGFPKSVCTSLNNEICHGIPDENIMIQDGDIINVDVFYHTATSASALEAQTYVCAHKCAVFYIDVLHATRHFTTYYESTVSVQYRIIFNDNVLARFTATAAVFIFTGFDTDSIISRIE